MMSGVGPVDDTIVNGYLAWLQLQHADVSFIPTFVTSHLRYMDEHNRGSVARAFSLSRRLGPFTNIIFMPFNTYQHWTLVTVDVRARIARLYNSHHNDGYVGAGFPDSFVIAIHWALHNIIGETVALPADVRFNCLPTPLAESPQQQPRTQDCGICILRYAQGIASQLPYRNFDTADLRDYRNDIFQTLLTAAQAPGASTLFP